MSKEEHKKLEKLDRQAIMNQGSKTLNEFKEFISRGNVIDMAVGTIIGAAFGKIVTSIVNDILMPIIGVIIGGIDFSGLSITFKGASIKYGMFIQNVIDFLIVAVCIFMFVKVINKITRRDKKKEEEAPAPAPVDEKTELLKEIRDLLEKQEKPKKQK